MSTPPKPPRPRKVPKQSPRKPKRGRPSSKGHRGDDTSRRTSAKDLFEPRSVSCGRRTITVCGQIMANVRADLAKQAQTPAHIPGLAVPGRLTIIHGAPKSGKTTGVMALAAAATRGEVPNAERRMPRKVMIVQLEETPHETVAKFEAYRADLQNGIIVPHLPGEKIAALENEITVHRPDIVIIDSLSRVLRSVPESSPERMTAALEPLQELARRFGNAILLLHHANKQGAMRGSTAIAAVADVLCEVSARHDQRITTFRAQGRIKPVTFSLRANGDVTRFDFIDGDDVRGLLDQAADDAIVTKILRALSAGPQGSAALRRAVGGSGIACDRAARRLAVEGRIRRAGPKKPWELVRPAHQALVRGTKASRSSARRSSRPRARRRGRA